MSRLFRGMTSKKGKNGESTIKKALINQLSTTVKDLQIDQADEYQDENQSNEATNALCTVLEALFLHGLKDSFLRRVTLAVRTDIDERPEPDFWAPLLVVSHRNVIDQISNLTLVTTDIGRSRAWIRLALNDSLMSRYLETIRREGQRALSQYYRPGALLRDTELLDVAQRLIEGVEAVPLNLPLNSSLFDSWTQQPLLLAGLWTPPLRATALQQAVTTGVEVAEVLDREDRDSQSDARSMVSMSSFQGLGYEPMSALREEDALKIILGTPVYEPPIAARARKEQSLEGSDENPDGNEPQAEESKETSVQAVSVQGHIQLQDADVTNNESEDSKENADDSGKGNSLSARFGWSTSFEGKIDQVGFEEQTKPEEIPPLKKTVSKAARKLQSYRSLVESYRGGTSTSNTPPPNLDELLQQFKAPESNLPLDPETEKQIDLSYPGDMGYEVVDLLPSPENNAEYGFLLQQMTKLPLEHGLDNQNYTCFDCKRPIGLNFVPVKVCGLSGHYFCKDCVTQPGEEWVIPSRILHNWDFRRFQVSLQAARFLKDIQHHPLFDVKTINPRIYLAVQEMTQLQTLRTELNLLRAYLFTCRNNVIQELQKSAWPREYLYEHVHLYSLADLLEIPTGSLPQLLKKIIEFARGHVLSCWLCSQKGFFCEICYKNCKKPKVIYPFDTSTTYRCSGCNAVYHAVCLNSSIPCPKCDRRRRREDESIIDAVA